MLDVALALTLLGGALHQGLRAAQAGGLSLALLASLAPSAVAAALLVGRAPARGAGPSAIAAALPSLVLPLAIPLLAVPPSSWPLAQAITFGAGAAFTCWALAVLGRSFAILPASRPLVVRGPYRLVRHPVYAGELVMWCAACATLAWPAGLALAAAGILALRLRIHAEERALGVDPAYVEYSRRVRDRLLPGLARLVDGARARGER